MIIELFGAAGAGKSTLARALADALTSQGHRVRLVCSARPAETRLDAPSWPMRLAAPCLRGAKLAGAIATLIRVPTDDDRFARALLGCAAPAGPLGRLRRLRYLADLHRSWREAARFDGLAIFDQGLMSALGSLMMSGARLHDEHLDAALDLVPRADLLVFVDTPRALIETRLRRRLSAQSWLERRFEPDLATSLRQVDAVERLMAALAASGASPVCAFSHDESALRQSVRSLVREVSRIEAPMRQPSRCSA
jgi:predicted ATPase